MEPFLDEATIEKLGPALTSAFKTRGYNSLTQVQQAVLDTPSDERDLRILSQTGSGKTVAIGLALRDLIASPPARAVVAEDAEAPAKKTTKTTSRYLAEPLAIVIAPTRELGKQIEEELTWLYGGMKIRVTSVTGGTNLREEQRALARKPTIVVGTPGRLLDHLRQGVIGGENVAAVILDEADRMLDMGFAEDLESIFGFMPKKRRTHLVSATFSPEVVRLATKIQQKPLLIEGTQAGKANADIAHVIYLTHGAARLNAAINILLMHRTSKTLVFTKMRASATELADKLADAGFAAASLSGDMAQHERVRTLAAFKKGALRVLVATDVAARGIDVPDVELVLHMEPPGDPDAYTHRSGRTGRAGRQGKSALLISPSELIRSRRSLSAARVKFETKDAPGLAEVQKFLDEDLFDRLAKTAEAAEAAPDENKPGIDPRALKLAKRLVEAGAVEQTLARLLMESNVFHGPEPRDIPVLQARHAPVDRGDYRDRFSHDNRAPMTMAPPGRGAPRGRSEESSFGPRPRASREADFGGGDDWVLFEVSWGGNQGADKRRITAMACRRGDIRSGDIGQIEIGALRSTLQVRSNLARDFADAASRPDPRDPRVQFRVAEGRTPEARSAPVYSPRPKPKPHRGSRGPGDAPARPGSREQRR